MKQPAAVAAELAARVVSVQGQVEVLRGNWVPLTINQELAAGSTVRTGPRSRAVLLLADETQLKLNDNTRLTLREVRQTSSLLVRVAQTVVRDSDLTLEHGQTWIRSKVRGAGVRVSTPAITAAIRGTEFDIRVGDDGETVATVLEGSIDFRNTQGAVLLNPREQGRARVGQAPTKVVLLNPENAVQWTLVYTVASSPRDYPFQARSASEARAALGSVSDPVRRAQLLHDSGDLDAALAAIEGRKGADVSEVRGWILLEQNRLREAADELARASSISPRVRLALSSIAYRLDQFAESYEYVRDPGESAPLKVHKALLDLVSGDAAAAREALEGIPESSESYALAQGLLSNVHLTQNDRVKARQAAERAVQSAPESPSAWLSLSLSQQSEFDLGAATKSAERALELDQGFIQSRIQLARLLLGSGLTGRAEQVVRGAIASAPEESEGHSTLGFVLLARGKTREAEVEFDKALQLDSMRGEPRLGLGVVRMREGLMREAVTHFLAASTLESRVSVYQSYLAKAFYEQRKFEQSFTALAAARELDPRDPTPLLYAGVFENDLNRPGSAVRDLEGSIRLNENRAVYRSRFVLDEDRATRNVNLAAAYNRLGLTEWADLQALRSTLDDPGSSSARLFLANTFLNLPGRTLAAGGELLMTRLLMPVNANSFNAFNDYTTLFERTRLNFTAEGVAGSFDRRGTTFLATGGARRYAYSSLFRFEDTNGFRSQNDDAREYTTVNFLKVAPTPHSDLLLSLTSTQNKGGDHGGATPLVSTESGSEGRTFVRTHRVELGYHAQFRPGSDLVALVSGRVDDSVIDEPNSGILYIPPYLPVSIAVRTGQHSPGVGFQAAHILKLGNVNLQYGVVAFGGRVRNNQTLVFPNPANRKETVVQELEPERSETRSGTVFAQANFAATRRILLTAGMNYDRAETRPALEQPWLKIGRWNPQGGAVLGPFRGATFRFAAFRTLQTAAQERLAPTHVDGFVIAQNEQPLSVSKAYSFGWDQRIGERSLLRTTGFDRRRAIPSGEPDGAESLPFFSGRMYGTTVSFSRLLAERWSLVSTYDLTRAVEPWGFRHDHEASIGVFFVSPSGLSAGVKESLLNQRGTLFEDPVSTRVYTTGLSLSYELPRKRGLVSFRVDNLTHRRYAYLADPLALDPRVPARVLSVLMRVNF